MKMARGSRPPAVQNKLMDSWALLTYSTFFDPQAAQVGFFTAPPVYESSRTSVSAGIE